LDLATSQAREVGPVDLSVWEVDWDGAGTVVGIVSREHSGSGWYQGWIARLDLETRVASTLYEPVWQLEGLALAPGGGRAAVIEGYASDHGLLSGSVMVIDLHTGTTDDPWPQLQTVGRATWCADDSLWYARTDGTGNACGRIWLDGRLEERWRDDAFVGDAVTTPGCVVTEDASAVWTTHQAHGVPPELARFDPSSGGWTRLSS
jgi:dipeptidyl aminopeptidase/acylaminoacyl peptidase